MKEKEIDRCFCGTEGTFFDLIANAATSMAKLEREIREVAGGIDGHVLLQYVKEPFSFSAGYFDAKKMLAAANGTLTDKNGKEITAAEYIKSNIEMRKVGYLIAFKKHGRILIGWAQWYKMDTYCPDNGVDIAINRALKYAEKSPTKNFPYKIAEALPKFIQRANNYFKDAELVDWAKVYLHNVPSKLKVPNNFVLF